MREVATPAELLDVAKDQREREIQKEVGEIQASIKEALAKNPSATGVSVYVPWLVASGGCRKYLASDVFSRLRSAGFQVDVPPAKKGFWRLFDESDRWIYGIRVGSQAEV
jgi:hypothetical protein